MTAIFVMFGLLFAGPLYFQTVLGHDALAAGLRQLPMIAPRSGELEPAGFVNLADRFDEAFDLLERGLPL